MTRAGWIGSRTVMPLLLVAGLAPAGAQAAAVSGPRRAVAGEIARIACAAPHFCAAVTIGGRVATTNAPFTSGHWTMHAIAGRTGGPYDSVSCPSRRLCAATIGGNALAVSTDPVQRHARWTVERIGDQALMGVACPSTTECVVTDDDGDVFTSTDPAGGAATFVMAHVDNAVPGTCGHYGPGLMCHEAIVDIACPTGPTCLAVDNNGNAVVNAAVGQPGNEWSFETIDPRALAGGAAGLNRVSCPKVKLCVTADGYGQRVTSVREPFSPAAAVHHQYVRQALVTIDCPTLSFCVAADDNGQSFLLPIHRDTVVAPQRLWRSRPTVTAAGCVTRSACVVGDERGDVFTFTPPAPPVNAGARPTTAHADIPHRRCASRR